MRILFKFFSLVLLDFSYAPVIWAQCRVPSTSSSLGSVSSITLNGVSQTSQASTGFNCDAPTLSLAGTNRVIATFCAGNNASAGLRQLKHTTKSDVFCPIRFVSIKAVATYSPLMAHTPGIVRRSWGY